MDGEDNQIENEDHVEEVEEYTGPKITDIHFDLDDAQIDEIWLSQNPKGDVTEIVKKALGISDEDALVKDRPRIETIAEFYLGAIIFVKDPANKITGSKAALLVRILGTLMSPSKERTADRDFQDLKNLLLVHTCGHPQAEIEILSFEDVKKAVNYVRDGYFLHYRLYSYVLEAERPARMNGVSFFVDEPRHIGSLAEAEYKGEGGLPSHNEDDDFLGLKKMRASQEAFRKAQSEDEFSSLDDTTKEIVARKVQKMKEIMEKQIEDRQGTLDGKLEDAKTTLSKKKKK